ncbi:hypothetical protein GPY53_24455 [Photorhabdus laumondii subsp. laumondii]|uniref:hypothetical protein n=1 Tax=Photorhabdus laumondii TaxID=2218628 RepID=UPI00138A41D5|nr:hypothetical protein [Photorhabdus laumondii]NDK94145.1 hypothetical protein [Photorhabdus laumondii subsp. laumondii]NDL32598.1 hypothetical protein [Photorhabdus laumondii subsp. laumondii]
MRWVYWPTCTPTITPARTRRRTVQSRPQPPIAAERPHAPVELGGFGVGADRGRTARRHRRTRG